ncbi:hypothetical protein [Acinetobacter indicus]|uniref:RipA family octameric membrane protein n=1 Tax=Acinetobacter indicus TaxID=756892 RepID=UPI002576A0A9|nr:hypothetical protein [Acinetobacter indicus]MDM1302059.1 hypothetical protein [Acinetobacter indicus]
MGFFNLLKTPYIKLLSFKKRYKDVKEYQPSNPADAIDSNLENNRSKNPLKNFLDEKKLKNEIDELKSVYKLSIETRNFEISNLIHRNNFFMLFQGVLLAAVFSNQASKPFVESIICFMGIFISWHQIKVAAGAKYWQEWWEVRTSDIELALKRKMKRLTGSDESFISLFDFSESKSKSQTEAKVISKTYKKPVNNLKAPELFENISKALISGRYSVSRVPISSGIVLLLTWFVLFIGTFGVVESISNTASKYELCYKPDDKCVADNISMLKDLWIDFKLINGHYFADNEEPPTQIIFNQYNQK